MLRFLIIVILLIDIMVLYLLNNDEVGYNEYSRYKSTRDFAGIVAYIVLALCFIGLYFTK